MQTKVTLKSKTHNFGLLLGVFGGILTFLPTAREFIPEEQYGNIFIALSVITIVLRNLTTTPIEEK